MSTEENYRAEKSGINKEAQEKVLSKYDANLASEVLQWIAAVTGETLDTDGSIENFTQLLKDGQLLCRLVNVLMPEKIKKINAGKLAFKLMENIDLFLRACRDYGLTDAEIFQTCDLWDGQNIHQVSVCLLALARKAQMNGLVGIGPKEAARNERNFTAEQLAESNKIIGLQYGTNKLASQKGISFGNTRHM